jgi:hypothetical protein
MDWPVAAQGGRKEAENLNVVCLNIKDERKLISSRGGWFLEFSYGDKFNGCIPCRSTYVETAIQVFTGSIQRLQSDTFDC